MHSTSDDLPPGVEESYYMQSLDYFSNPLLMEKCMFFLFLTDVNLHDEDVPNTELF